MSTLKELIKNSDALVVDVRSPLEYATEHIPGAQNIPLEEVTARLTEFRSIHKPVVLYCRGDRDYQSN